MSNDNNLTDEERFQIELARWQSEITYEATVAVALLALGGTAIFSAVIPLSNWWEAWYGNCTNIMQWNLPKLVNCVLIGIGFIFIAGGLCFGLHARKNKNNIKRHMQEWKRDNTKRLDDK